MKRPIGYYVHHQGAGHRHRARLVAAALDRPCTLLGTFGAAGSEVDATPILDLPDDRIGSRCDFNGRDVTDNKPQAFHYAPIDVSGLRHRMALIAAWIAAHRPALMVIDVSVEVALFARLMSVPVAVVRLTGSRIDGPHLEAFRAADVILAPFPAIFESADTPSWVKDKTYYGGFLALPAQSPQDVSSANSIVVVAGQGGVRRSADLMTKAARAMPSHHWHVYGPLEPCSEGAPNLTIHGWQSDIGNALATADIIIGGAGDGLMAEVAVRAKRFICCPEDRPFNEQHAKAAALSALGLAVVLDSWPEPASWPSILRKAQALDPLKLHRLTDSQAIEKFAAMIETTAARHD